jgi:hypothetical protein
VPSLGHAARHVAHADEAQCRAPALLVRNDGYFRHERRWRGAGVAIPVFSLRSHKSVGCGEFADLCELVDFCAEAGRCRGWEGGRVQGRPGRPGRPGRLALVQGYGTYWGRAAPQDFN